MNSPFSPLYSVATAVVTIGGVVLLPWQTYDTFKSMTLAVAVGVVTIFTLATAIFRYYYPGSGHWKAGYSRYPTYALLSLRNVEINISSSFVATIDKYSELIFFDHPQKDDLVDLIDSLPGEKISQMHYRSDDSEVSDLRQKSPNNLVVYWRPKSPISPFQTYVHRSTHESPSKYGPNGFYNATYIDRDVGVSNWKINLPRPAEEAIAFILPVYQSQVTHPRLYKHWRSHGRRGCEQPEIISDDTVVWSLRNPQRGRVYVIFVIYRGERESVARELRNSLFHIRIWRAIKRFGSRLNTYLAISRKPPTHNRMR